jgi:hypothetical protein
MEGGLLLTILPALSPQVSSLTLSLGSTLLQRYPGPHPEPEFAPTAGLAQGPCVCRGWRGACMLLEPHLVQSHCWAAAGGPALTLPSVHRGWTLAWVAESG